MEQTDNDKERRGIMVERNSWRTRMGKAVADGLVVTHFHADNWEEQLGSKTDHIIQGSSSGN